MIEHMNYRGDQLRKFLKNGVGLVIMVAASALMLAIILVPLAYFADPIFAAGWIAVWIAVLYPIVKALRSR